MPGILIRKKNLTVQMAERMMFLGLYIDPEECPLYTQAVNSRCMFCSGTEENHVNWNRTEAQYLLIYPPS